MTIHNYIGVLSGTSMDAVDTALVSFKDNHPPILRHFQNTVFPDTLKQKVQACIQTQKTSLHELAILDHQLGKLFATAILNLCQRADCSINEIKAIGSHGQTILHHPIGDYPYTLQLGDPNIIAKETGITTVADFRRRDLAAGGQGAPLAPIIHQYLFSSDQAYRIIVNIGGIANITVLPPTAKQLSVNILGFDCGPGNTLLDACATRYFQTPYDKEGRIAASGQINEALLARLMQEPFIHQKAPKSTGTDYFNWIWLDHHLGANTTLSTKDIMATLTEFSAKAIATHILDILETPVENVEIILCGGGARNAYLIHRLEKHLANQAKILMSDTLGYSVDSIEAILFAYLAKQNITETAFDLCSITGATEKAVLGARYISSSSGNHSH